MQAKLVSLAKSLTGSLRILKDLTGNCQHCPTERGPELDWMLNKPKGGLPYFRGLQGGFQTQAVATAYQPMPQAVLQGGTPVMMAPTYLNQMGAAKAPVMVVPVQNMQQMPGASGNGLMYVQVPANQVLSGSTQENTSSQVPQVTTYSSGPLSSEDMQGTI